MPDPPKLKQVTRLDSITLDQTYFTDEGYLIDHPIVTSTGIFEYANPDGSVRRELRLPEHVFEQASLDSYKGKPIIVTHDAGMVTKDNVDDEIIGTMLSAGYQDGDHVRAEIVIHSTDSLKCGLRELSLGYNLELDETPGEWNGQPYDAVQTNIRVNHLALVKNARAGESARLNVDGRDKEQGGNKMSKKTTRQDSAPALEEILELLKQYVSTSSTAQDEGDAPAEAKDEDDAPAAENADGDEQPKTPEQTVQMVKDRKDRRDEEGGPNQDEDTIKQMDEDINSLLGVIDQLTAQKDFDEAEPSKETAADEEDTPPNADEGEPENNDSSDDKGGSLNMDSLDRIFAEKLEIVRIGDRLNLDGLDGLSPMEGKKRIIHKVRPDLRLDGKSPAYVQAAYDMAKLDINKRKDTNYQRQQMQKGNGRDTRMDTGGSSAAKARQKMIDNMMSGGDK